MVSSFQVGVFELLSFYHVECVQYLISPQDN